VVAINEESGKAITAKVELPRAGDLVVAMPEEQGSRATSGTVTIPARSAAVLMEQ
jgi:hypothetical protein